MPHFAPFPSALVRDMIKVACPKWICKKCGEPQERIYERLKLNGEEKPISGKFVNAGNLSHSPGAREKYYTTVRRFRIPKAMQIAFAKWLKSYIRGKERILDDVFGRTKWEHWIRTDSSGACLPEPEDYKRLKKLLNLPSDWDKWLLETVYTLVDDKGGSYKPYGWSNYCLCGSKEWQPGVVLDPFLGSGTTALVAIKMGRRFIGIEISPKYCEMAFERIKPYLHKTLDQFA
ncbi:MAG: site-specific DNA-methyltransferase [Candidatus Aminicenantes bacterium]|nr:site-specific DNA-methyltransferase [Candidatus Aminicenantes bacterium]